MQQCLVKILLFLTNFSNTIDYLIIGGDPNLVTDDFAGHLSLEHRTGSRDLISFLDEPSGIRHGGVRRIPHSGRALGGPRSRRSNMQFSSSGGGLSTLSPSGRESVDPIAELLQQLSGVRRGAPQPSQLQQLQMQIQMERQQVTVCSNQIILVVVFLNLFLNLFSNNFLFLLCLGCTTTTRKTTTTSGSFFVFSDNF